MKMKIINIFHYLSMISYEIKDCINIKLQIIYNVCVKSKSIYFVMNNYFSIKTKKNPVTNKQTKYIIIITIKRSKVSKDHIIF